MLVTYKYQRFELCRSLPAGSEKFQYAANQQWQQHHRVGRRSLGQVPRGTGPAADPAEEGERRPKARCRIVSRRCAQSGADLAALSRCCWLTPAPFS